MVQNCKGVFRERMEGGKTRVARFRMGNEIIEG